MSTLPSGSSAKASPEKPPAVKPPAKVQGRAILAVPKLPSFVVPNLYWRLVVAGILGLTLIGGAFFSASQLKKLVTEIERKKGQETALQEKDENIQLLSVALRSVKGEAALIEKALPNEEGVVEFIRQMTSLAEGITIEVFNFDTDQPHLDKMGNSYIEWTVEASGSWPKLEEFLERLLALPLLIRPKVIDLDKMDEEPSKLILKAWLYVEPDFFVKGK